MTMRTKALVALAAAAVWTVGCGDSGGEATPDAGAVEDAADTAADEPDAGSGGDEDDAGPFEEDADGDPAETSDEAPDTWDAGPADTSDTDDASGEEDTTSPPPPLPTLGPVIAPPTASVLPAEVESCAVLGATACVDDAERSCDLWDAGAADWATEVPPMTEQAFVFDRYYDLYHEFNGQTVDVDFTQQVLAGTPESEWSKPEYFRKMNAYGDASGWTGTAAFAAAGRYAATGTEADYERMLRKLEATAFFYEVTGIEGMMARSHWGMLPEGGPEPVGEWGKALGAWHTDDGSGWHYHYPIAEELLPRLPDYYHQGVTLGGTHHPTEPRWQGDSSRDMYVRSMPGLLMAYDLLGEGEREDAVRQVLEAELPCTLNRLKKARITNLQEAPELKEALAGYLAGGALTRDEGDLDFTTLDTIVLYVMEQPNPAHWDLFDVACPDGPPMEVDPELDLDATSPSFIFDVIAFLNRMDRAHERPIVWPMVVSVRASDLLYMTQWALVAHYLTGDEAYLGFLDQLMAETDYWGVLNTWGAFQVPKWCQSHYAPSLSYPSLYNVLARVDREAAPEFWTALSSVAANEARAKEMEQRGDSYFGVLYSQMVDESTDPTADTFVATAVELLEGYGLVAEDKLEPDRNYSRNWIDPPHPDIELEPLDPESQAFCETPVELLGVELDAVGLNDANPRATEYLPLSMRVGSGFLWTSDPWRVLKDYGPAEATWQYPMLGMTTPYWVGRAHGVVDEGQDLALAWRDTGDACGGEDPPELPDTLVLDPDTLSFFGLPIGSIRFAVSGHDPDANVCATLIWDYSNNGEYMGAHCDDFYPSFPYVVLETNTEGPCGAWDYGTDVVTEEASGCVDFAQASVIGVDLVDVAVQVSSEAFTGTILADNRATFDPAPVTFGIEASSDIPESLYVQSGDALGLPTWVQVTRDGQPVWLFDRCDIPMCGEGGGVCGQALPQALDITGGQSYSGEVYLTWDGLERVLDAEGDCLLRQPAAPGSYSATFCLGWSAPDGVVQSPYCEEVPFELDDGGVVWWAGVGG